MVINEASERNRTLAINALTPVKAVNALQQLRFQFLKRPGHLGQARCPVFLETAQTGADNLTREIKGDKW